LGTIVLPGTPSVATAQQQIDCANFLDSDDAQVAFDADPADPFGLDGDNDGEVCEQPDGDFGTSPLVSCDDLEGHADIALALYDHALTKYGSDRYNLAGCVEQVSTGTDPSAGNGGNRGSQTNDPEVLDGVPTEADGSMVIVNTGAIDTGQTLEARLETRFAALEAQFAAFEVRAANGFGRFPESGNEVSAGEQAATVSVSTLQQPITTAQRARASEGPTIRVQKAKDGKGDRTEVRRGKRDRHTGKHRNRR